MRVFAWVFCLIVATAALAASHPYFLKAIPIYAMYSPEPRGTIEQTQLAYLAGQSAGTWRAVVSKKNVTGHSWIMYFSIYQPVSRAPYKLRYQDPPSRGVLASTSQLNIIGAGQFETGAEQVVTHAAFPALAGQSCGTSSVTVTEYVASSDVVRIAAQATNPCRLDATIHAGSSQWGHGAGAGYIILTGPHGGNPNAQATLRYQNGRWVQSPNIFRLARRVI